MTLHFGSSGSLSAAFASSVIQQHQPLLRPLIHIQHPTATRLVAKGFANYGNARLLPTSTTTTTTTTILHVNPIAIMGGAASVSVNTDILNTPAIVTMVLLALQYCAQPPITRKFLDNRANKKGVTMVEEIVKITLSGIFFLSCGKEKRFFHLFYSCIVFLSTFNNI